MNVEDIIPADIVAHLPDGLQEGLALDIAHRAPYFDDDHIGLRAFGQTLEALFYLAGNMGHHLDSAAQELAPPLFADNGAVNLPGGDIGICGELHINETLVVAQVQVCLGTVPGDEHLAVLVRGHCARVNVEIGV